MATQAGSQIVGIRIEENIMRSSCLMALLVSLAVCTTPPRAAAQPGGAPGSPPEPPKAGEPAPLMTLKSLDGKSEVKLASFAGERPALLMFGSYT